MIKKYKLTKELVTNERIYPINSELKTKCINGVLYAMDGCFPLLKLESSLGKKSGVLVNRLF
jgi:hypothetical protein